MRVFIPCVVVVVALLSVAASRAAELPGEQAEFFETKVRPLLAERCYTCHSAQAKTLKGGLRLDSLAAALRGGESGGAIVPGKPDDSLLIQAVRWQSSEMPPNGKLPDEQIAVLVKWVELGAPWPETPDTAPSPAARNYDWKELQQQHWAWRPIAAPAPPSVRDGAWPRNEIDYFVLSRLEAGGVKPNPPAEPRTLLRRLTFDLTGLPPTPAEAEQFEREASRDRSAAITALVDRLLSSPQYGERWGRHWLDVARYSDGYGGFLDSAALPNAWRYRDWVVSALNRDLPFDEFVRLQIAGDLIDPTQSAATGFLALGPTYISDGGDPDAQALAKLETLDDRLDTVSRGLMALTVACSRCHDHRFDPFPQLDYYSLAGVFNNTRNHELPLAPQAEVDAYQAADQALLKLEGQVRELQQLSKKEERQPSTEEQAQLDALRAEIKRLKAAMPKKYPFVHTLAEAGSADMNVATRGNLLRPGVKAPRRFLRIIGGEETPPFTRGSGRLDLADALTSPTNPLTARVIVNRIWQRHFGFGLVRTPSNFGVLGEKPSHPELLDWLAAKFSGSGDSDLRWSLKQLHRLVLLSATYQMASAPNEQAVAIDGDNRLLWRMTPRRLDVEAWRDAVLAATGELDQQLGGPSVEDIAASSRRTLYAAVSRNGDRFSSDTFLRLFDFPTPRATSEGRTSSIVPQQSLFLMNSSFMVARCKALTNRLNAAANDDPARIRLAYELLYGRTVTAEELSMGLEYLRSNTSTSAQLSTWQRYAQVLLSASEMMYVE